MEDSKDKKMVDMNENKENVFEDPQYICKSSSLITSSLKKGAEVAQMSNGDVMISESKIVTTQFHWNKKKKQFKKVSVEIG